MRAAFNLFDPDGEGKITKEGLQNTLKTLGKAMNDDEVRKLIGGDVDGMFTQRDGKIDYDTFVQIFVRCTHRSWRGASCAAPPPSAAAQAWKRNVPQPIPHCRFHISAERRTQRPG